MKTLVFIRHGQSKWNLENKFTGWTDVPLSEQGLTEAADAGRKLKDAGLTFDIVYTSLLKRAIKTAHIVMEEIDQLWLPEEKSWRLNERHYGALQGLNKAETAEQYGDEQVLLWRRSYDILPPLLADEDKRSSTKEAKYQHLDSHIIPRGESLKVTLERTLPYWEDHIAPSLLENKSVLVVAHGNSLRSLAKYLEDMTDEEILKFEIPTGKPLVYELKDDLSFSTKYYL
ncbi:2,3-diphosphoglycerate-dependent phosphoglycerate mutase [Vagococcus elongatus]|uniref:2,3-bisphosphoglycerate-dependent phosphoglycerate mutase n=1 Tax=Vagococcus elongatus TaxID=180344 RepID=A0A430AV22_9ENTE|nr:2,3-diphosphoglycerate-dependent phosphoglycerate mutase [Vagococcus elongatus]RSU11910.1 phosphoglyceromutase [Vagococcus elongatus]